MHDVIAVGTDAVGTTKNELMQHGIKLFDMRTLGAIATLNHHRDWVSTLVAAKSSPWLFSGSWDHSIALWDLRNMCQPFHLLDCGGNMSWIRALDYAEDTHRLFAGDAKGGLHRWDLDTLSRIDYLDLPQSIDCHKALESQPQHEKLTALLQMEPFNANVSH
jgi:WD40 repeat protein